MLIDVDPLYKLIFAVLVMVYAFATFLFTNQDIIDTATSIVFFLLGIVLIWEVYNIDVPRSK